MTNRDATPTRPEPAESLYVYALMDAAARSPRVRGHRLEIVEISGLFAAVERLSAPPGISESALRDQHDIVVRLSRGVDAILPVRFGAFVDSEELARVIHLRRTQLLTALDNVRGKAQMTVRVFGPPPRPPRGGANQTGAEYLLERAKSLRVALPPVAAAIRGVVQPLASAEQIDQGRGGIHVTLHHLVRHDRADRYRSLVESTVASLESPPAITVSGPWPPFAFAPDLWSAESVVSQR
jgi:hypothetical protein